MPWVLASAAIGAQILWPLTSGGARVATTEIVVALFAGASISHAAIHRGPRWAALYTAISVVFGFAVERVGTATGWPFSPYEYTDVLQPQLFGVPVVIPLAWAMMAYPAYLVGRRLARGRVPRVLVAAFALSSWDLFLDPQMVGEGYWRWLSDLPALPGIPGIPAVNYLGWYVVSLLLMAALSLLPGVSAPEGVPALLYGWTWVGGIVANAIFLGRPGVALVGGVVMGLVAVPYLRSVLTDRTAQRAPAPVVGAT